MTTSRATAKPTLIDRKRTANEHFDKAVPIEIHRTAKKAITLTLATVKHTTKGPRMEATLGQFDPRKPEDDGLHIRLDSDDLEVLAEILQRAAPVMNAEAEGRYLVTPVSSETVVSPQSIDGLLATLSTNPEVFEALAGEDALSKLDEAVSHLGRLAALKQSISQLEAALKRNESSEAFYQTWCERNSWAFGLTYIKADDIRTISRKDKVDLLLQRSFGGYRDLVELKTPTAKVLERVRHFYVLTKGAAEALGQALHYTSVLFQEAPTHGGLRDAPEIRAYRPRAIVVIGSSAGWTLDMRQAWHAHNCALTDVQLWTFEQLIDCGKRAISVLSGTDP